MQRQKRTLCLRQAWIVCAGTTAVEQALLHDHLSRVAVMAAVRVNQALATAMRSRSHRRVRPIDPWNPEVLSARTGSLSVPGAARLRYGRGDAEVVSLCSDAESRGGRCWPRADRPRGDRTRATGGLSRLEATRAGPG
jgi:hypothetical protein